MKRNIKVYISMSENYYVADCLDVPVVTQGKTLDETLTNLKEAIDFLFEDESPADYDLEENPSLVITMEVQREAHAG